MEDENPVPGETTAETAPGGPPAKVVVITVEEDGSRRINPIGVDPMSLPTLLRVMANDVESQLGI